MAQASDKFAGRSELTGPPYAMVVHTKSDSVVCVFRTTCVWVGTGGNLAVQPADGGATVILKNVVAGMWHPMRVDLILATGTTCADIVIGGYPG